jgi:predicted Kef-type K+ transport protein
LASFVATPSNKGFIEVILFLNSNAEYELFLGIFGLGIIFSINNLKEEHNFSFFVSLVTMLIRCLLYLKYSTNFFILHKH